MARFYIISFRNRIDIEFDYIPSQEIRDELKSYGWCWNHHEKRWYNYDSDFHRTQASYICAMA